MNKKYWLLVGIVFLLISIVVAFSLDNIEGENPFLTIIYLPAIAISLLIYGFDDPKFGAYIIFAIYGFVVGSVLGFIFDLFYKKFKKTPDIIEQPDFNKKSFKIRKVYIIIATIVLIFLGFFIYMRKSCTGLWEYQAIRSDDGAKCLSSKCVSMKCNYVGL